VWQVLHWIMSDLPPLHAVFLLYVYKCPLKYQLERLCVPHAFLRLLFLADLCKAENSAVTRMTAENLAVVFAPCLMASNGTHMSLELIQMENRKRVVTSLILAVQTAVGWA
jgi:hypothetical protein